MTDQHAESDTQTQQPQRGNGSELSGLVMPDHAEIYLVHDGEGWCWCDDPAPGDGMSAKDAIRYVRADLLHHVAFDRDECTVTIAFENEHQVLDFIDKHESRNRVRVVDDEA